MGHLESLLKLQFLIIEGHKKFFFFFFFYVSIKLFFYIKGKKKKKNKMKERCGDDNKHTSDRINNDRFIKNVNKNITHNLPMNGNMMLNGNPNQFFNCNPQQQFQYTYQNNEKDLLNLNKNLLLNHLNNIQKINNNNIDKSNNKEPPAKKNDSGATTKTKKKRMVLNEFAKKACFHCKKGHRKCDNNRPCNNCKRMNKQCYDVDFDKRRKKKRDSNADITGTFINPLDSFAQNSTQNSAPLKIVKTITAPKKFTNTPLAIPEIKKEPISVDPNPIKCELEKPKIQVLGTTPPISHNNGSNNFISFFEMGDVHSKSNLIQSVSNETPSFSNNELNNFQISDNILLEAIFEEKIKEENQELKKENEELKKQIELMRFREKSSQLRQQYDINTNYNNFYNTTNPLQIGHPNQNKSIPPIDPAQFFSDPKYFPSVFLPQQGKRSSSYFITNFNHGGSKNNFHPSHMEILALNDVASLSFGYTPDQLKGTLLSLHFFERLKKKIS